MKAIQAVALGVVAATAAIVVVGGHSWRATAASSGGSYPGTAVDAHGNLHVPADYRDTYQLLGSWAVAADEGRGSKELHVVLASPGSVEDDLKGWFVMVKDSAGRYPGNALWGDGWGWSWFDAANPTKTTSTDYRLNCKSCHVPAQATDWIYVDGYPALKR